MAAGRHCSTEAAMWLKSSHYRHRHCSIDHTSAPITKSINAFVQLIRPFSAHNRLLPFFSKYRIVYADLLSTMAK